MKSMKSEEGGTPHSGDAIDHLHRSGALARNSTPPLNLATMNLTPLAQEIEAALGAEASSDALSSGRHRSSPRSTGLRLPGPGAEGSGGDGPGRSSGTDDASGTALSLAPLVSRARQRIAEEVEGVGYEEVFEQERRDVSHTPWGRFRLPDDPDRWSDVNATRNASAFEEIAPGLPDGSPRNGAMAWRWEGDWAVDLSGVEGSLTDNEGWVYASAWRPWLLDHEGGFSTFPSGSGVKLPSHFVRRRRWARRRRLAPTGNFGPLSSGGGQHRGTEVVEEELFENERRDVRFTAWRSARHTGDPPLYSDCFVNTGSMVFWEIAPSDPPPGWAWESSPAEGNSPDETPLSPTVTPRGWSVDTEHYADGLTDRNGWCYGPDFFPWLISRANECAFPAGSGTCTVTSFCRRRRWRRKRVKPQLALAEAGRFSAGWVTSARRKESEDRREAIDALAAHLLSDAVAPRLERTLSCPLPEHRWVLGSMTTKGPESPALFSESSLEDLASDTEITAPPFARRTPRIHTRFPGERLRQKEPPSTFFRSSSNE